MNKIFLVMFGGTPARGELCLYLNAAAGLYQQCSIRCYPIDKDIESPNYINTRNLYNQYTAFREVVSGEEFGIASAEVKRTEDLFENMLRGAVGMDNLIAEEESIRYLMSDGRGLGGQEQRILNICFTQTEQKEKMKGGYYGKANIGSVTGDILMHRGIYKKLDLYRDIENALTETQGLDVVIVCSSFGGTGASLGINFGEYLRREFQKKENLRIHCIYIQPYFSFPNPQEEDQWKIDFHAFYAKSATATFILGQKENFIRESKQQEAVFDRFYYLGQDVLDNISDRNSAMSNQDNRIHIVDMLVSLVIEDILTQKDESRLQLYGYQYANMGTDFLSWDNMPRGIYFKTKHVCMMRFCEFMLDCMEPLFADHYPNYGEEALMLHMYGHKGGFLSKTADIEESIKVQLQDDMRKCFEFCRSYIKYWIELEETTKLGHEQSSATQFFNTDELKRILKSGQDEYDNVRFSADSLKLTEVKGYDNYKKGKKGLDIYDSLCHDKRLKGIAKPGKNKVTIAKTLTEVIYDLCKVENYKSLQD